MVTEIETEHRYIIHYCYRSGLTPAETYWEMKNVFGKDCFQLRMCEWRRKEFKDGRQLAELLPHTGRLASVCTALNINTISVIIREDWHLSLRKLEDETNISRSSLHRILCDQLKMRCISSTWVPHFLTTDQMNARIAICKKWLSRIDSDPDVLMRVITVDESWVLHFEPLLKHESATWKLPSSSSRKKKECQQWSVFKIMLAVFFDTCGSLYQHILLTNTMMNIASYCKVLRTMCYDIGRKRPHLRDQWLLHHDNARPHTSNATWIFLIWNSSAAPSTIRCTPRVWPIMISGYSHTSKKNYEESSTICAGSWKVR